MSFDFTVKEFILGNGTGTPTFQFYRRGFNLNGSGGGPSWQDIILSGTGSLTLTNAKANGLNYLTLFGATEQRNLPAGYTQTAYTYFNTSAYLTTDFVPTYDCKVEFEFKTGSSIVNNATTYLGARPLASGNGGLRVAHITSGVWRIYGFGSYADSTDLALPDTKYKFVYDNGHAVLTTGDTVVFDYTFTNTDANTYPVTINGWNSAGTVTAGAEPCYVYKLKGWDNQGNLSLDYVPATYNTSVGFYDNASNSFETATTGTLEAGPTAPTPDTPMDIVSNNGVVKARHQSGLPLGYTLLDSVVFDSTQVLDTGFIPNNNSRIESKCYKTGADCWFYGASPTNPRITLYHSSTGTCRWGNESRSSLGFIANTEYTLIQDKNGLTINGTLYPWNSGSAGDFTCDRSLTIGNNNGSSGTRYFAGNLYYFKIYDNNVLVRDYLPVKRNSDNALGIYDRVNGTFLTDSGLTSGNPVSDSIEIYTDGTVETVKVTGKNLFDKSDVITGKILNDTGAVVNQSSGYYSGHISVNASTGYTISQTGGEEIYLRILEYDSTDTMVKLNKGAQSGTQTKTFTTGATTTYVIVSGSTKSDALNTLQLELGSTTTTYEPYFNGGTATAEMLLKVGDYQDVQSVLDGVVTRKVGVKVLDGTESWAKVNANNVYQITVTDKKVEKSTIYCSHFQYSTGTTSTIANNSIGCAGANSTIFIRNNAYTEATDFARWLADQYNAGTPVVVVYPLATPTTETVTAQPLTIQAGSNVVEITQASIDNLELEVSYKGTV